MFGQCPLWPNGWMDEDATCYGGRPRPRRLCVRWASSSPQKKGTPTPTQFLAHVYCGETGRQMKIPLGIEVGLIPGHIVLDGNPAPLPDFRLISLVARRLCLKMPLSMEVGLSPGEFVLDGDPVPSPKGADPNFGQRGTAPAQFSANVRYGQTVGWTEMPLGVEVGLGLGDFVFDGDPAPPEKRAQPRPIFVACLLWPTAGWIKMPLGAAVNLGPGDVVLDGVTTPWPRSPISATAELL